MVRDNNVTHTVLNQMCTGCGICEDVCPKHCISIKRVDGEHRPVLDEKACLGDKCGKCLKVCPGVGIDFQKHKVAEDGACEDKYIGSYVGLHTGYSLDEDIRYHSASGGMVSQFLIYLLDKHIIDGAVVTGYADDHITPVSYIARNREEVISARSSKYCPVALNKVGNEIASYSDGKYVIVGTPCHIQGFRKRMAIDRKLRDRIIGLFAIYCSSGRNFNGQDFLFQHYGVQKDQIKNFAYRDNGCLGSLIIQSSNKQVQVPFSKYYGSLLRSFFKPHRCLTCIDHYGELADVCFGDIHILPYSNDNVGISSWITRSQYWEKLFKDASSDGYIKMDDVDAATLNKSQAAMLYPKARRAKAVMNIDRLLGRKNPVYDKLLESPGLKDYLSEFICMCQQFVGRHKGLWFVIKILHKRK